jgi:hypothetical protein
MGGACRMREKRNAYTLLVGKPEGRRSLGRPKSKWVDNIKIDLGEIDRVDWKDHIVIYIYIYIYPVLGNDHQTINYTPAIK